MKKTKKINLLILILIIPLIFSGCGEGDVGSPQESFEQSQVNLDQNKYENNLEGLQNYLHDMDLISGQSTDMLSEIINAKKGIKYTFKYNNSNITAELYEFENVGDDVFSQVNSKGTLNVLGKEVPATVSNNKKFLLIYSDKSTNGQNIDKANKIKEAVKNFSGGSN
ncbi:MAG: hypothetical protein LBR79_01580 [Oscillospiraceae bacterium]|jgi:hypothetical protein|nr:hypothetical protein [Oscillospiraceae bacterium]